jgi:hypothetical protein
MTLWLYLLSDPAGSWPVLREQPLPSGLLLCDGRILVELFGRFTDAERAWAAFHKLEALAAASAQGSAPRTPLGSQPPA